MVGEDVKGAAFHVATKVFNCSEDGEKLSVKGRILDLGLREFPRVKSDREPRRTVLLLKASPNRSEGRVHDQAGRCPGGGVPEECRGGEGVFGSGKGAVAGRGPNVLRDEFGLSTSGDTSVKRHQNVGDTREEPVVKIYHS